MHPQDLRQTAGDFSAGDLTDQDAEAFLDMIKDDTELAKEVDFWKDMQQSLREHGRPEANVPGAGFNDVLRARLEREESRLQGAAAPIPNRTLTFPAWARLATAAIAATIFVVVGLDLLPRAMAPERVTFAAEGHGEAVIFAEGGTTQGAVPLHTVSRVTSAADHFSHAVREKAWVGMWAHPVHLDGFNQPTGLLIDRLVANGPAHSAGLCVGDVILGVNAKEICGAGCLHKVMRASAPGSTLEIRYLNRAQNTIAQAKVIPQAFIE